MTGQFDFKKFSTFLKSFWGILAGFTAVLPTIIYFTNSGQIKDSIIHDYYIGIPTTFSLLCIPFVFLYEDSLSDLRLARKMSLLLTICALLLNLSFITIKNFYIADKSYTIRHPSGNSKVKILESRTGKIQLQTYNPHDADPEKEEIRVNFLELVSLLLYSFSIILLTASFATLGVFFYTKHTGS